MLSLERHSQGGTPLTPSSPDSLFLGLISGGQPPDPPTRKVQVEVSWYDVIISKKQAFPEANRPGPPVFYTKRPS
jgi:hypothetical protein